MIVGSRKAAASQFVKLTRPLGVIFLPGIYARS